MLAWLNGDATAVKKAGVHTALHCGALLLLMVMKMET